MAYSQSKKLTDLERRIQKIKLQLYGKNRVDLPKTAQVISEGAKISSPPASEVSFLRKDLMKILILATLAIGVQIILFLSKTWGLLKF